MDITDEERDRLAPLIRDQRVRKFGAKSHAYKAAGVNSATWDRAEAGEAIRDDRLAAIVRTLWPESDGNWAALGDDLPDIPESVDDVDSPGISVRVVGQGLDAKFVGESVMEDDRGVMTRMRAEFWPRVDSNVPLYSFISAVGNAHREAIDGLYAEMRDRTNSGRRTYQHKEQANEQLDTAPITRDGVSPSEVTELPTAAHPLTGGQSKGRQARRQQDEAGEAPDDAGPESGA